ncbi:MAG: hypothetical protein HZC28_10120 [Spirochaetes bacterium]|nr:hypothetical protein [Spirochaetota bacterium]
MKKKEEPAKNAADEKEYQPSPHRHWPHPLKLIGIPILGVIGVTAIAFLFGYIVMLLWNWLMPPIFGLKVITYLQAVGIIILSKLIISPFIPHHKPPRPPRNCFPSRGTDTDWNVKGGWGKWRYYDEYWKEEGKAAFEKYVERREKE